MESSKHLKVENVVFAIRIRNSRFRNILFVIIYYHDFMEHGTRDAPGVTILYYFTVPYAICTSAYPLIRTTYLPILTLFFSNANQIYSKFVHFLNYL